MPAARPNAISERLFRNHPMDLSQGGGRLLSRFGSKPVLVLNARARRCDPRSGETGGLTSA